MENNIKRIRDDNRLENERKKRKSDKGEKMKERNERRKMNENRKITGTIKYYIEHVDMKSELLNKMDRIKLITGEKVSDVTNINLLNEVFDFFLRAHKPATITTTENDRTPTSSPFEYCEREDADEPLYLTSMSGIRNMCASFYTHGTTCSKPLDVAEIIHRGHAGKVTYQCAAGHTMKCDTSPHIAGGKLLSNIRFVHAVMSTGIRYSQYERLCKSAKIGICAESYFDGLHGMFCEITANLAETCIKDVLEEEVTKTKEQCEVNENEYSGIAILTDARHGWRRNAAQSDVLALGSITHKVFGAATINKDDDHCSQRHDLLGVKKLYKHFKDNNIKVNMHGHDRNMSVNKYIREEQPHVQNSNDTWHAAKGVTRAMTIITTGTGKMHAVTWHCELADKAASIRTHCYYAMKICERSVEKFRNRLDNICEHYKGNHTECDKNSRCNTDENYVSSKLQITSEDAERLLCKEIKNLQLYKTPADYINCVDTHYVESVNNATLVYHDKRIVYSNLEYLRRTNVAILDWIENVDREFTSVRSVNEDPLHPRQCSGPKVRKPKTFVFIEKLWNSLMTKMYDV